jgi:acyl carrier protein
MLDRVHASDRLVDLVRQFAPGLPLAEDAARVAVLSNAGLTSMAAVRLMLAIEAEYAIAIPDSELTPAQFATVDTIDALVARLRAA